MIFPMKRFVFLPCLVLTASVSALADDGNGLRSLGEYDPDYDVEEALRIRRDERRAEAQKQFDEGPRKSTLRVSVAPLYLWEMNGDFSGGDGWGLGISVLLQMNSDTPDFKFLLGGEILAFSAEADSGGNTVKMRTANLMLTIGGAYDFSSSFSAGLHLGYGLLGATYFEEDSDGGEDESGTMSTVISVKPYAEFLLNKNFSVYAAYRYVYLAPSIISSAADWGDVEASAHGFELGFSYRF